MRDMQRRMTNEEVLFRLDKLRSKIESVPHKHREMLFAAADKFQEYHERLQQSSNTAQGVAADLGLMVEYTKFDLAARRRENRELNP